MPWANDAVMDGALAVIATANQLVVTSGGLPADRAGVLASALASVALTPGVGNGDFTVGNGPVSGRTLTVAAQTTFPVTATGSATRVCLINDSQFLFAWDVSVQTLTNGGTVSTPAFTDTIPDPS